MTTLCFYVRILKVNCIKKSWEFGAEWREFVDSWLYPCTFLQTHKHRQKEKKPSCIATSSSMDLPTDPWGPASNTHLYDWKDDLKGPANSLSSLCNRRWRMRGVTSKRLRRQMVMGRGRGVLFIKHEVYITFIILQQLISFLKAKLLTTRFFVSRGCCKLHWRFIHQHSLGLITYRLHYSNSCLFQRRTSVNYFSISYNCQV